MKKFNIASIILVLVVSLCLPAMADGEKKKKGGKAAKSPVAVEKIASIEGTSVTTTAGTYTTTETTKVTVNGKDATLSDLKEGMNVTVGHATDSKTADTITATDKVDKKKKEKK